MDADITMHEVESNTTSARKLVSVQRVVSVKKHKDADTLDRVKVLGWKLIIKSDTVKEGDLVVLFEVDSLVPVRAEWVPEYLASLLSSKADKKGYFRVKTIKLRGKISQGLIIPIADVLGVNGCGVGTYAATEGADLTALLGVGKYEPPVITGGGMFFSKGGGDFPSHKVSKTDEHRVQSDPSVLDTLKGKPYYTTIKMDGTSVTYLLADDPSDLVDVDGSSLVSGEGSFCNGNEQELELELVVCSRNMIRKRPSNEDYERYDNSVASKSVKSRDKPSKVPARCPYFVVADKYNIKKVLNKPGMKHLAIQGEICGPAIQRNLAGLKEYELFVFNVVDTTTRVRLGYEEMIKVCAECGLNTVPVETVGDEFPEYSVSELLKKAEGVYKGTNNAREGIVIRAQDQSVSFKVINNTYLLKA